MLKYSKVDLEICNGYGFGYSLYVQGCRFHCRNCFNPSTWDFDAGQDWSMKSQFHLIESLKKPYIIRVSLLGGEPMEQASDLLAVVEAIRAEKPEIKLWIYSGYTFEEIMADDIKKTLLSKCDVLVDGRYVDELRDITLKFRGSKNQRIIDIQESLKTGKVVVID